MPHPAAFCLQSPLWGRKENRSNINASLVKLDQEESKGNKRETEKCSKAMYQEARTTKSQTRFSSSIMQALSEPSVYSRNTFPEVLALSSVVVAFFLYEHDCIVPVLINRDSGVVLLHAQTLLF
jgi:hypothetical protein